MRPLTALVETIQVASTDSGPTVVGINGHSSSGKTTLARRLQPALPNCGVLHSDDLAWHQGVFGWGGLLIDEVLPVVRAGAPLRYRPPQWELRGREGAISLAGGLEFLILEGVGASMQSIRDQLDVIIWVETDEPTRAARNRARIAAGEDSAAGYHRWMVEENAYVIEHEPWREADVLVNGGDSIACDRDHEVVLAGVDLHRGWGANS